jgi:hypothetical protein
VLFPQIAEQWNYSKNEEKIPEQYLPKSGQKVWWKCTKSHEWEAQIASRTHNGRDCPYCAGKRASSDNNLQIKHPEIAAQWLHEKNEGLNPNDFTPGSDKAVWWECKKGHQWKANIKTRTKGRGCPYCSGNYVSKENSLASRFPKVADEWHLKLNGNLTPSDFTGRSGKKVWWRCKEGHEWEAKISHRTNGSGCPECWSRRRRKQ